MFMHLLYALICVHPRVALAINGDFFQRKENVKLVDNPKIQKTLRPKLSEIGCAMACLSLKSCCIASRTYNTKECILDISGSCEYDTEAANGTVVFVKDVPRTCELGWERFENHCYFFRTDRNTNWHNAQEVCQQNEANLVKLEDAKENEWVKGKANFRLVWIGLNDEAVEGEWRWVSDNSRVDFQDWHSKTPDQGSSANCGQLWRDNNNQYHWDDVRCFNHEANQGFICEKETEQSEEMLHGFCNN